MNKHDIDQIDRRILTELQLDGSLSHRELAGRIGLSYNACWRRVRQLEERGFITGHRALLDRQKLGFGLIVFMLVRTRHHSEEWLAALHRHVETVPEVIEFYRIGGDFDYLLKVATEDMTSFDDVYRRLIRKMEFETVTSLFCMEAIRENGVYPL